MSGGEGGVVTWSFGVDHLPPPPELNRMNDIRL